MGRRQTGKAVERRRQPISGFLDEESWIRLERLRDGRIGALIGNEYRVWSATLEPLLVLKGRGLGCVARPC